MNFLQNFSKTQFYTEHYLVFIVFTYGKIALCHTAYVTDRAMECQEFRQSTVSKSNFNRKINKLLVRIFQQGWYFYDRKRPNFQKMQKTQHRNFHCIYTLTLSIYNKYAMFVFEKNPTSKLDKSGKVLIHCSILVHVLWHTSETMSSSASRQKSLIYV